MIAPQISGSVILSGCKHPEDEAEDCNFNTTASCHSLAHAWQPRISGVQRQFTEYTGD